MRTAAATYRLPTEGLAEAHVPAATRSTCLLALENIVKDEGRALKLLRTKQREEQQAAQQKLSAVAARLDSFGADVDARRKEHHTIQSVPRLLRYWLLFVCTAVAVAAWPF